MLLAQAVVFSVRDWLDSGALSPAMAISLGVLGGLAVGMGRAPLDPRAAGSARDAESDASRA